jgi:hypothetical protein
MISVLFKYAILLAPFGEVIDTITASVLRDIVRHDVHSVPLAKVADDFS